jgi:hypothetical protein
VAQPVKYCSLVRSSGRGTGASIARRIATKRSDRSLCHTVALGVVEVFDHPSCTVERAGALSTAVSVFCGKLLSVTSTVIEVGL